MNAPAPARRDRLRAMLADLKMPGALEAVDGILSDADGGTISAAEAIEQLLNAQIVLRNNRRLQTAMRSSRRPAVKTLDQFDFAFQPSIKREQIESLHELGFLDRGENVILLGPPGVGKTHLAISLAIAAAEAGRRVYYGTLAGLIESLTEATAAGNLTRRQRVVGWFLSLIPAPRSVRPRKVRAAKLIADGLWVDLRRGKYDPIRQLRVGTPDADHVSCLPGGPTLAFAAGLAGVGSPRAPGSSRQRCGRCTGLDGVLCALRGGRSTQRPLRAVDDGQGADLCLRDGHILLARGGEEAGGGCSVSDARGGSDDDNSV